jgi:hypothetical protein
MTITLSDATWEGLSNEYLYGWSSITLDDQADAESNAHELAEYLYTQVSYNRTDGRLEYLGNIWLPVDNPEPYNGLEELSEAIYQHGTRRLNGQTWLPIEVSDCYHDHPVFARVDNLRFRIWHDTGHYLKALGFDRLGELQLFIQQAHGFDFHPQRKHLVEALFSESVYQLAASVVLGTFPDVQHVRTPGPVGRALLDAWGL